MAKVTPRSLAKFIPKLGPVEAVQNSAALQSLLANYQDTIGLLREQSKLLRSQRRTEVAGIREQRHDALQSAQAAAAERGVLGSSADITARTQIRSEAQKSIQAARNAFLQGLSQNIAQRMAARREFESGVLQQLALKKATQSQRAIDRMFEQFLGGGGNGSGGMPPKRRKAIKGDIRDLRQDIRTHLAALEEFSGTPEQLNAFKRKLRSMWRERNRLRRKLGLERLPLSRLNRLIDEALGGGENYTDNTGGEYF